MVYEDLRQPLLEDLYRHSVEQARLGPVLERLDDALGALCEATPKELHAGGHHALIYWCVTCSRMRCGQTVVGGRSSHHYGLCVTSCLLALLGLRLRVMRPWCSWWCPYP